MLVGCGGAERPAPPAPATTGQKLAEVPYTCFTAADTAVLTGELNRRASDGYRLVALSAEASDHRAGIHACVVKTEQQVSTPGPAGPTRAQKPNRQAASTTRTGIVECDTYVALVKSYIECDKVPAQARDATDKGLEQMQDAWASMKDMPPDARKAAADG
ncbi:MAG: hypothetical protein KJO07_23175, partial [Deltaproteobacteria bacterium]|nr:hypothetical protein [Deltaproteobacteria bacterium]